MTEAERIDLLKEMVTELAKRGKRYRRIRRYRTGDCPIPPAIQRARVTRAYQMLMALSPTNYARLIVKSATSRMEIGGIRTGDRALDRILWGLWQGTRMDSQSRLVHDDVLTYGRAFAIVWPSDDEGEDALPSITFENMATVIVKYSEEAPHGPVAALRSWVEKDVPYATIYLPDGVYKYRGAKGSGIADVSRWERRTVFTDQEDEDGPIPEEWPLENPAGPKRLPVVEIATNRLLDDSCYGYAEGDFESCLGLLDRINVLEFLRLVIAFTSGFPVRAVVGQRILRDDNDRPIAPFRLAADVIAQLESPSARLEQLDPSDLESFGNAINHDVETLAGICQTPAYYLRSVPIQNVSADAIRASDAPLNARVDDHRPNVSDGWEDMVAVAGIMLPAPVQVPRSTEIRWLSKELRSLSERADAATKLREVMPWQAIAELCFDASQDQIGRWEEMRRRDPGPVAPTTSPPAPTTGAQT